MAHIAIRELLTLEDTGPREWEVFANINTYKAALMRGTSVTNYFSHYQEIRRAGQLIGYRITVNDNVLKIILHNLFMHLNPETDTFKFEDKEYRPTLSIIADIPDELQHVIPAIYAKYLTKKEEEREAERQAEIAHQIWERQEAERRAREEQERKQREAERQQRLVLLSMPVPEEVLWLQPDAPGWLIEKVYKILLMELHPDKFQHFGNGLHREMEKLVQDISAAFNLIKEKGNKTWERPIQIAEKEYSK